MTADEKDGDKLQVKAPSELAFRAEFTSVTEAMLLAYVDRTGVTGKCLQCGAASWGITPAEGWVPMPAYLPATRESKQIPSCCLVCNNCGNIWLIALRHLLPGGEPWRKHDTAD